MEDFAVEQPGHRLHACVRVRRHVHRFVAAERQRTEAIQKTPRSDEPPRFQRKRARYLQCADTDVAG